MSKKVFPHAKWEKLISIDREKTLNREKFLEIAKPNKKETWADIGCGPGYFTLPLAQKTKKAFAVDVSDEMLKICRQRADEISIINIEYIKTEGVKFHLDNHSIDKLLLAAVYHEFSSKETTIREINRFLHLNGKVYIIDWKYETMDFGPPLDHRITSREVIHDFITNGFTLVNNWDIYKLFYVLEFKKNK